MSTNLHIVRKALIRVVVLFVLTAELTASGAAAFAQNYGTGMQSAPPSAGNAIVPGNSGPPLQPSLPPETGNAIRQGISATLLGVPVYGTAPLTVGFIVGIANSTVSPVYHWNFGDGAVSSLPAGVYMLHVYRQPGTYLCSLRLTTAQGRSTTVFTTIVVQPRQH
jgi:PKD repeat protein